MDREIDVTYQRKRLRRRTMLTIGVIAIVVAVFVFGPRLLKVSVTRAQIRTARVDAGPIEAQITATGKVVPEIEQVLSSPVGARVLKILKREGAILTKGEPILE
ncbi:MAG: RND transporter, partial [Acidobacteriota bacterium]|nr:RND transporter [Acidobacteriota bacterium]